MATASSPAQELITCDLKLCVKPVQQFCNSCQVGLCEDCINKHVNSHKSMKHDIVPFTKRTVQLVFPQCTSHSHQRCEAHCQHCDVPVCIKCLTGQHKGHAFEDMDKVIALKREKIKQEIGEIKGIILKSRSQESETENRISQSKAQYADLQKKTKYHRNKWHIEVDNIFNKLESLIQSLRDHHILALKSCQSKLRSQNSKMIQTVQENKEILKSNNVFSDVSNYQSKLKEYRNIPQIPDIPLPSLYTNTVQERELSIELGEYKATLTQTSLSNLTDEVSFLSIKELLEKAKVIANIPTNVKKLYKVACVGSDKAWFNGKDKMITCVDIHGAVQDTVTSTCEDFPNDITVTKQRKLIYSDGPNRTVNIVGDGKTETLITTPWGWHPVGLCCTRSGDILVSMRTTNKSHYKIVRYQGQRVTQEIDKDEHGDPIYQGGEYGMYVMENSNGDIVISDINARAVVVVNRTGKVRFRYNDKPPGGIKLLGPGQIVTDSMGHIIVADELNNCLHILDQNGQFLRCVDNCGLERPGGLSVDSEGRLWVGSYSSRKVKVIKYMK